MAGSNSSREVNSSEEDTRSQNDEDDDYDQYDDEYEVERILTERIVEDGKKVYLIYWKGYPVEESTWEPVEHIQDITILHTWHQRQSREVAGHDPAFDLEEFQKSVEKYNEDTGEQSKERARRQVAERNRNQNAAHTRVELGASASASESSEAEEFDSLPEDVSGIKRHATAGKGERSAKRKKANVYINPSQIEGARHDTDTLKQTNSAPIALTKTVASSSDQPGQERPSKVPSTEITRPTSENATKSSYTGTARPLLSKISDPNKSAQAAPGKSLSLTSSLEKRYVRVSTTAGNPAPIRLPSFKKKPTATLDMPSRSSGFPGPQASLSGSSSARLEGPRTAGANRGRATRGGGAMGTKRARNILKASSNPNITPRPFGNMRQQYQAMKQGRALEDQAPDLAAIGGLHDPSKPRKINPPKPAISGTDSEDGLFVDQIEPAEPVSRPHTMVDKIVADTGAYILPPYQFSPRDASQSGIKTCFFWDRKRQDQTFNDCDKGDDCTFLHDYRLGVSVAAPPGGLAGASRKTTLNAVPEVDLSISNVSSNMSSDHRRNKAQQSQQKAASRPQYQQSDGFHAICYQWYDSGGDCPIKDGSCRYIHKNDPTTPVAPKPLIPETERRLDISVEEQRRRDAFVSEPTRRLVRVTCYYWGTSGKCRSGSSCKWMHEFGEGMRVAPFPGSSKRVPPTCKYWEDGRCYKSDRECEYLHGYHDNVVTPNGRLREIQDSFSSSFQAAGSKDNQISASDSRQGNEGDRERQDKSTFSHIAVSREYDQSTHRPRQVSDLVVHEQGEQEHVHILPEREQPSGEYFDQPPSVERQNSPHRQVLETVDIDRSTKMSPADYSRFGKANGVINGCREFVFGDIDKQSLAVDLSGFPFLQELPTNTKVCFNQMCLAADFKKQMAAIRVNLLWQSDLVSIDRDLMTSNTLTALADELRVRSSGLVSVARNFVILAYPDSPEWSFIEPSKRKGSEDGVRLLVFRSGSDLTKPIKPSATGYTENKERVPIRKGLVKSIQALRFSELVLISASKGKRSPTHFYLAFPSTEHSTLDFVASWIYASYRQAKIYSSQDIGSWPSFLDSASHAGGVVLIHESVAFNIREIPSLKEVLKTGHVNLWYLSESGSPYDMLSSAEESQAKVGRITTTRLFPHGHALFLTPSFMVAEPKKTLDLLRWFLGSSGKVRRTTPGSWKLVVCHDFASYVLDVAFSKLQEKAAYNIKAAHETHAKYEQMVIDSGLDKSTCEYRYHIYQFLRDYESRGLLALSLDEFDSEPFGEHSSPIVFATPFMDPDDEVALVEWFAIWALRNLDKHRKFTVLGTEKSAKTITRLKPSKKKSIQESMDDPRDAQDNYATEGAEMNIELQGMELIAPSSSPASNKEQISRTAALEGKERNLFVPRSVRAKATDRKDFPKKLSNIPSEHVVTSDHMDIDTERAIDLLPRNLSPSTSVVSDVGENEEDRGRETIIFEPTTEWYSRHQKNGKRLFEHLSLVGPREAMLMLNEADNRNRN